jgi:uncharacterized protein involved in exopolysaccharide biosynthesis
VNNYEAFSEGRRGLPQLVGQQTSHFMGVHGLMQLVRRRLRWIIGSVVVCTLFSIIITALTRPVYDATATIELNKAGGSS